MTPALLGLSSVDLPDGKSLPPDPADCWVVITASIGTSDDEAADNFTFYVCTPRRLAQVLHEEPYVFGRHLIIVDTFSWFTVESAIASMLAGVQGAAWSEMAAKIARFGAWEFEDYREVD